MALEEVKRVVQNEQAKEFLHILTNLHDGIYTEEEWRTVCETCCRDSMTAQEWKERFGAGQDVTYLYCTNEEVKQHSKEEIQKLSVPFFRVEAFHSTSNAKKMADDHFQNLEANMYIAVGAKVQLTSNIGVEAGLCNGTTEVVKDIIYTTLTPEKPWKPLCSPVKVFFDFGESYRGQPYFPNDTTGERRGWAPIYPKTASTYTPGDDGETGAVENSRKCFLFGWLAWAWTIHKSQGQTFTGKMVLKLGDKEMDHGLTYVTFSRVTILANIGIIGGLSYERFTTKILNQAKVPPRQAEEQRLSLMSARTVEGVESLRREGRITGS